MLLEKKKLTISALVLLILCDTQSQMANAESIGVSKQQTTKNTNPFTLSGVCEGDKTFLFMVIYSFFMFVSYNSPLAPIVAECEFSFGSHIVSLELHHQSTLL